MRRYIFLLLIAFLVPMLLFAEAGLENALPHLSGVNTSIS